MIRKILGLGAVALLLGPISCLSDDGPDKFETADQCFPGDVEGCTCTVDNPPGIVSGSRGCGDDNRFSSSACRCEAGCTIYPDCTKCGNRCIERCVCHRMGQEAECQAACGQLGDAG